MFAAEKGMNAEKIKLYFKSGHKNNFILIIWCLPIPVIFIKIVLEHAPVEEFYVVLLADAVLCYLIKATL